MEPNTVDQEPLPNLEAKYKTVQYLGSGRNDAAWLVQNLEGQNFVALGPIVKANPWHWEATLRKVSQVPRLDSMGLSNYITHKVDAGILNVDQKVIVVEYAGVPISEAKTDAERIDIFKQITTVVDTLHRNGYSLNDLKEEHWLFLRDKEDNIHVKLIDYTQIRPVPEQSMEQNSNDHRLFDLLKLVNLMVCIFPWFRAEFPLDIPYHEAQKFVHNQFCRLEEQSKTISPMKKLQLKMVNALRSRLRINT